MDAPLRLNPGLIPSLYVPSFARNGLVQVPNFLHPEDAERLAGALETATTWALAISQPSGDGRMIEQDELNRMGREGLLDEFNRVLRQARDSFAFAYLAYPMIQNYLAGRDPGHPLHRLSELLNGQECLEFVRQVTGEFSVIKIDGQATRYRPGDFLTLHDDAGEGERRAAYTLGFTRHWRADWGGQLLFHDAQGEVTRGLKPTFNTLTLFKTPMWHSVAPVAAYAGAHRHVISGWLRDDPSGSASH